MGMTKKLISVPETQNDWLIEQSRKTGLSEAEIVRRALDREKERLIKLEQKPF